MDLAKTLVKMVCRAFYKDRPEYIIIVDAILLHSALRDEDLAFLMGMQTKGLRKLVSKLREDGIVSVSQRQEMREGAHRPFMKDYYYVNMHYTVDVIKYRLKLVQRKIDEICGQKVGEKKEYYCPRCKSEYTQMEVLSFAMGAFGFVCDKCGHEPLDARREGPNGTAAGHPGHEMQSRFNSQMAPFEDLLRQIDGQQIPENDFETALSNAIPVQRDERLNPTAKIELLPARNQPATVHGLKQEAEKVQVDLADTSEEALKKEAERKVEEKARKAAQNALPAWHTTSTVSGDKVKAEDPSVASSIAATPLVPKAEEDEDKKDINLGEDDEDDKKKVGDDAALNAYYAAMEDGHDDSDDSSDDSDGDSDDDSDGSTGSTSNRSQGPQVKRVRIEEPGEGKSQSYGATPGGTSGDSDEDD